MRQGLSQRTTIELELSKNSEPFFAAQPPSRRTVSGPTADRTKPMQATPRTWRFLGSVLLFWGGLLFSFVLARLIGGRLA